MKIPQLPAVDNPTASLLSFRVLLKYFESSLAAYDILTNLLSNRVYPVNNRVSIYSPLREVVLAEDESISESFLWMNVQAISALHKLIPNPE